MSAPLQRRIRELRETLDLTQVQFAAAVGKTMRSHKSTSKQSRGPHPSTVARWENGSSVPGGEYLEALVILARRAGRPDLFAGAS